VQELERCRVLLVELVVILAPVRDPFKVDRRRGDVDYPRAWPAGDPEKLVIHHLGRHPAADDKKRFDPVPNGERHRQGVGLLQGANGTAFHWSSILEAWGEWLFHQSQLLMPIRATSSSSLGFQDRAATGQGE